ncbi:MAG: GNAT family N-acetyltransferase [Oscillospiraceae bacterium]|nr:GNAT family N-acetyltransferase [Oscillospiraceae bacterium]
MAEIKLRTLNPKDAPLMLEWMKDIQVNRYFRFNPDNVSIDSVNEFIANSQDNKVDNNFAIVDHTDEYLGTVSLKNIDTVVKSAEYAIALRKSAQGKKCGYHATMKILEYGFYELGLQRIYLNVSAENKTAVSFYERFGFVYEGEFVNHISIRGELHTLKWYRLLRDEWEELPRKGEKA